MRARTSRSATERAESVISVRDVTIGYDRQPIVTGASLEVTAGEVVAVLGPNGSGKSTLVRGILGLTPVLAGTVTVFGAPLDRHHRQRHRVGYVPQRHTVSSGVPATVREVVLTGRLNRTRPWRAFGSADRAAVTAAIATVGLAGREDDPLHVLSGGQQRRALFARTLAGDPDLLLLDEPTAGVDADSQAHLTETLGTLAAQGKTTMIVAHELGTLAPILTRVIVVRAGRIEYDGPPRIQDHVDSAGHHHHEAEAATSAAGGFVLDGPQDAR